MLKTTTSLVAALLFAAPVAAETLTPAAGPQVASVQSAGAESLASAPLAADGRIFAPSPDCAPAQPRGCSIVAYDARTGAELWQRALDTQPDGQAGRQPAAGGDHGSLTWVSPVYDKETDTLFVALSAAAADSPQPLVTYALDARTGAVEWFRRAQPGQRIELESASAGRTASEITF